MNKKVKKKRVCLGCDRKFNSSSPGNRICAKCKRKHEKFRTPAAHHASFGDASPSDE